MVGVSVDQFPTGKNVYEKGSMCGAWMPDGPPASTLLGAMLSRGGLVGDATSQGGETGGNKEAGLLGCGPPAMELTPPWLRL